MEGGRHRKRARAWHVDDEPVAVALLGDMTTGLSQTKSAPARLILTLTRSSAMPGVLVAEGTHVEMPGVVLRGDLRNAVPEEHRKNVIRIHGHTFLA